MDEDSQLTDIDLGSKSGSRSFRPAITAVLAVIVLAAATMFGVRQLQSSESASGASSPEEAVQMMVASLEASDLLGVAEIIDPVERRNFSDPAFELIAEMQRLGLIADSFDLAAVDGLNISFTDMTYNPQPFGDDMTRVTTSGTWLMDGDYTAVPYGPALTEQASREELADLIELREVSNLLVGSHSWNDVEVQFSDLDVVTVQRNGAWFVSLAYSGAEAKRKDEGYDVGPNIGGGPAPQGGATPEDAVSALATAIASRNAEQILSTFDRTEAAVAYDYFNVYGEDAQSELESLLDEVKSIRIDRLDLTSTIEGDTAEVAIEGFAFTIDYGVGAYVVDSEAPCPVAIDWRPAGTICVIDQAEVDSFQAETGIDVRGGIGTASLRTTLVGDQWFISPTASVLDPILELTKSTEPSELRSWLDDPESLLVPTSSSPDALIAKDGLASVATSMLYFASLGDASDPALEAFEDRWESNYEFDTPESAGGVEAPPQTEPPVEPDEPPAFVLPEGVGGTTTSTTTTSTTTTSTTTTSTTTTTAAPTTTTSTIAPTLTQRVAAIELTAWAGAGTPASQLQARPVEIEPVEDVELLTVKQAQWFAENGWVLEIDVFQGEILQTRFFCDPLEPECLWE